MNNLQNLASRTLLRSGTSVTTNGTTAIADTLGFNEAKITIGLPAASATNASNRPSVIKVFAGNTTTFSEASEVKGLIGTTNASAGPGEFVILANNNTEVGVTYKLHVPNLGVLGRYLFLQMTGPTGSITTYAEAELTDPRVATTGTNALGSQVIQSVAYKG